MPTVEAATPRLVQRALESVVLAAPPQARVPATRAELIAVAESDYDARLVAIDRDQIRDIFSPAVDAGATAIQLEGNVASSAVDCLAYLLTVTAINYRCWRRGAGGVVRYQRGGKVGRPALWEAFSAAWGLDDPAPQRLRAALAQRGMHGVFGDIPDPAGRQKILDEMLGAGAVDTFCATVVRQGRLLEKVTVDDASALARRFPVAFADRYLMKAQLALALFSGCARHAGISHDATNLTALADEDAPRILRSLGVLKYASEVAEAVDAWQLLPIGSAAERAIRAATILACEEVAAHTGRTAIEVDSLLRLSRDVDSAAPFHLTETTAY
jgi:Potential Queuosine, Q, salvage protein family